MEYTSVLVVMAALVALVTAQVQPAQLCAVQDGDFNDGNRCLTFIRCRNGVAFRFACPRRLPFFDPLTHRCRSQRHANCVMHNPFAGRVGLVGVAQQPAINQVQVAGVPAGVGQAAGGLVAQPNAFGVPAPASAGVNVAQPAGVPGVVGGLPAAGGGAGAAVAGGGAGVRAATFPGWAGANVRAGEAGVNNQAGLGLFGQQPQLNPAFVNNNNNPAGAGVGGGVGVVPGGGVAVAGFVPPLQQPLAGNANVNANALGGGGFLNLPPAGVQGQGQGHFNDGGARAGFVNGNVAAGTATAAATAAGNVNNNNGVATGAGGRGQGQGQGSQRFAGGQGRVLGVLPFGVVANQRQTATINQNQSVGVKAGSQ